MSLTRLGARAGRKPLTDLAGGGASDRDERFEFLTKYIPTETITLFVSAISTLQAIERLKDGFGDYHWQVYAIFAGLTPLFVLITAYAAYQNLRADLGIPGNAVTAPFKLPIFEMLAALLAFLVWALAVPGMVEEEVWQIAAAFGAVFISTILAAVESILPRKV